MTLVTSGEGRGRMMEVVVEVDEEPRKDVGWRTGRVGRKRRKKRKRQGVGAGLTSSFLQKEEIPMMMIKMVRYRAGRQL